MTSPRILDAKGRELSVGDPVLRERVFSDGPSTEVFRKVSWLPRGGWVVVTNAMAALPTRPAEEFNTYRCPALRLITDQEKERSDG